MKFTRKDYNGRIVDLENKIPQDEVCFLLRGQDILAPKIILEWAKEFRLSGGDPRLARDAEDAAQAIIDWQKANPTRVKLPDSQKSQAISYAISVLNEMLDKFDSGGTLNMDEFKEWVINIYGNFENNCYILIASDLINPSKSLETKPVFDDFKLSKQETFKLFNSNIVLFFGKDRGYVLKNTLK